MAFRVLPRQDAKAGLAMIGLLGILKYPCEIWVYLLNDIKVNRLEYFSRWIQYVHMLRPYLMGLYDL